MFKTKIRKYIMYHFLFVAIHFVTLSYGMLSAPEELDYPHIIQKPSIKRDKLRIALDADPIRFCHEKYTIVGHQKRGVCFDFAFMQIFNIFKPLKILGGYTWISELNALRFFDNVEKPQKNCLAIYMQDEEIEHAGIVSRVDDNKIRVISKWGVQDPIIYHSLFNLPRPYGDKVYFFALKEKYAHLDGKKRIEQKIQKNIEQAEEMNTLFAQFQHDFHRLAEEKQPLFLDIADLPSNSTNTEMAAIILKKIIGIDIDDRNENNRTALMNAAEKGNLSMVKLCIDCGADRDAKDSQGKTASQLAFRHNHREIVQFLQKKKIKA